MKEFVSLTDVEDVQCASQMCRCMGNISEVIELHENILQVFNVERLIHLYSRTDQLVALELSRLYANLAGNFNIRIHCEATDTTKVWRALSTYRC